MSEKTVQQVLSLLALLSFLVQKYIFLQKYKYRLNEFDESSASEMTVPQVLVSLLALLVQKY